MSYNEQIYTNVRLKRLLLPNILIVSAEIMLALVIILASFASDLETKILGQSTIGQLPVDNVTDSIASGLSDFLSNNPYAVQALAALVWTFVLMLLYIFIFRLSKLAGNFLSKFKKDDTSYLVKQKPNIFVLWLGRLHDLLLVPIVFFIGLSLFTIGLFLIFVYAHLLLVVGFEEFSLGNTFFVIAGFLATLIGVRTMLIGLALISKWFRIWYWS